MQLPNRCSTLLYDKRHNLEIIQYCYLSDNFLTQRRLQWMPVTFTLLYVRGTNKKIEQFQP